MRRVLHFDNFLLACSKSDNAEAITVAEQQLSNAVA
jgi:hypothetical protein